MVQLLIGHKGSGKTKRMCDMANEAVEKANGSVVFLSKSDRLTHDLKYTIRIVCMQDYNIANADEYIGFVYGIISSDHDLEYVYIDSILKHADFTVDTLPGFLNRLEKISNEHGTKFVVSMSLEKEEMEAADFSGYEVLEVAN